jgi:hypothetical protein
MSSTKVGTSLTVNLSDFSETTMVISVTTLLSQFANLVTKPSFRDACTLYID